MSSATVHFHLPVNENTAQIFRNLCMSAVYGQAPASDCLKIMISSVGGSVHYGITMYEFLRTLPIPVEMYNVGAVESIACIVFLGADRRFAVPGTHFKLHGFEWTFPQPTVAYSGIADAYISINNDVERCANIFEERTYGAEKVIDVRGCLRGATRIISDTEAVAIGITTAATAPVRLCLESLQLYPS